MSVLLRIAASRARLLDASKVPPFTCHLTIARAELLRLEMVELGSSFGVPIGIEVPEPREGDHEWVYLGLLLGDVHCYRPLDAGEVHPR